MALQSIIGEFTERLRQGRFPNEQSISLAILRVFLELGWDSWDHTCVWPEYQTGGGRADFALCSPASKPAVLVEVKQLGRAEEGVRQSLEYAFTRAFHSSCSQTDKPGASIFRRSRAVTKIAACTSWIYSNAMPDMLLLYSRGTCNASEWLRERHSKPPGTSTAAGIVASRQEPQSLLLGMN